MKNESITLTIKTTSTVLLDRSLRTTFSHTKLLKLFITIQKLTLHSKK